MKDGDSSVTLGCFSRFGVFRVFRGPSLSVTFRVFCVSVVESVEASNHNLTRNNAN